MSAVNLDVAEPPIQVNSEDAKMMSLVQIVRQKDDTEAELESLCNLMYQLNKARLQYECTVDIVSKLNSSLDGMPISIPLTNSMYVQGDICNTNKILLSMGNDYQMEVDKETAMNHFFRKIQRIKTKTVVVQKILAAKIVERERLRKAATEKYLEEKKKKETGPLPELLTG